MPPLAGGSFTGQRGFGEIGRRFPHWDVRVKLRGVNPKLVRHIQQTAKRVFHILGFNGYARMDFRLDPQEHLYNLEANPNAQLAYGEDLAESAERAGISYEALIQRILNIGLSWKPESQR